MNDEAQEFSGPVEISRERVEAMRAELKDLSRLNAAMFRQVFGGEPGEGTFFSARFDQTNPVTDDCAVPRGWDIRIEGDFYLVKRVHNIVYVIVGDATGHHAYAGGLKVFVAAALQRIFDGLGKRKRALEADKILIKLEEFFSTVGEAALAEGQPLEHGGADVIVLRIDTTIRGAVTYASAGLPVTALGRRQVVRYGEFHDGKGISFRADRENKTPFRPERAKIRTRGVEFLVIVTDGFRGLERRPRGSECGAEAGQERFGDERVNAALQNAIAEEGSYEPAERIADSLVAAARSFRKGHSIPEPSDDDRLVVVIDLGSIWSREEN